MEKLDRMDGESGISLKPLLLRPHSLSLGGITVTSCPGWLGKMASLDPWWDLMGLVNPVSQFLSIPPPSVPSAPLLPLPLA